MNCYDFNNWSGALITDADPYSSKALAILRRNVTADYSSEISTSTTAKEAWEKLKAIGERAAKSKMLILVRSLHNLSMENGENVHRYVARAKELRNGLKNAGHSVDDSQVVTAVLAGLPTRYRMFVQAAMLSDVAPTLDGLMAKLVMMEGLELSLPESDSMPAAAFYSGPIRNRPQCSHCNKPGHTADNCWQKNRCKYCGKTGHPEEKCFRRRNAEGKDTEVVALTL